MTAERDEKEDKEMTDANDLRRAYNLLDDISIGNQPNEDDLNHLRSFLPELPKQKTLKELRHEVWDAWVSADGDKWASNAHGALLETWLLELHEQLQGLESAEPAKPAHPEFLETEADYAAAPNGTIVASDGNLPSHKYQSKWSSVAFIEMEDAKGMSRFSRRVLRWGWGNE